MKPAAKNAKSAKTMCLIVAAFAVVLASVAFGVEGKRLVIADPPPHTTGAFRPFAIPGEIDAADGFVELRQGRAITVWCPEDVARDMPDKVAAARRFIDSPFLPVGSVSVAYIGDSGGAHALESLGVRFTRHDARWLPSPAQTQIVVIGPGAERSLQTPEEEKAFREWISSRTVLMLPGADLSLLPFGLSLGRAPLRAEEASVPDLPVFAGIQRDFGEFLRFCAGRECDVVEGGPAWLLAARPACLAHLKTGNMSAIIMTVAPGDVPEPARSALTRVWCTILANLNVETPADVQALRAKHESRHRRRAASQPCVKERSRGREQIPATSRPIDAPLRGLRLAGHETGFARHELTRNRRVAVYLDGCRSFRAGRAAAVFVMPRGFSCPARRKVRSAGCGIVGGRGTCSPGRRQCGTANRRRRSFAEVGFRVPPEGHLVSMPQ